MTPDRQRVVDAAIEIASITLVILMLVGFFVKVLFV